MSIWKDSDEYLKPFIPEDGLLCVLDEIIDFDSKNVIATEAVEPSKDEQIRALTNQLNEIQEAFKQYRIMVQERFLDPQYVC
jgi:hypothetical protein